MLSDRSRKAAFSLKIYLARKIPFSLDRFQQPATNLHRFKLSKPRFSVKTPGSNNRQIKTFNDFNVLLKPTTFSTVFMQIKQPRFFVKSSNFRYNAKIFFTLLTLFVSLCFFILRNSGRLIFCKILFQLKATEKHGF